MKPEKLLVIVRVNNGWRLHRGTTMQDVDKADGQYVATQAMDVISIVEEHLACHEPKDMCEMIPCEYCGDIGGHVGHCATKVQVVEPPDRQPISAIDPNDF